MFADPSSAVAAGFAPALSTEQVRAAPYWFTDPKLANKVLVLRPKSNSSTPDVYLYVPEAVQLRMFRKPFNPQDPALPLKPVVMQIQVKSFATSSQPGSSPFGMVDCIRETSKALHGKALAGFINIVVMFSDRAYRQGEPTGIKPGLYTCPERGSDF